METLFDRTEALVRTAPVLPILTLEDADKAVPLARALAAGGLPWLELTLRTDAALEGIRRIAAEVPEVVIGAGTVLTPAQVEEATAAGARFLVSPGVTPTLVDAMLETGLPVFPGVATASEVMVLLERGLRHLKFFPAEAVGGVAALKALTGPLPLVRFCPTGGIDAARARRYLALPAVPCVGGSWVAPPDAIRDGDWDRITALALEASRLRG